jgi:hypothetical protein
MPIAGVSPPPAASSKTPITHGVADILTLPEELLIDHDRLTWMIGRFTRVSGSVAI